MSKELAAAVVAAGWPLPEEMLAARAEIERLGRRVASLERLILDWYAGPRELPRVALECEARSILAEIAARRGE